MGLGVTESRRRRSASAVLDEHFPLASLHRHLQIPSCDLVYQALRLLPATLDAQDVAPSAPAVRFEPFTLETRGHGAIAAELGTIDVPVRHEHPAGATRALRFVRLRARSGSPSVAPVIYLAGGPGGSGIAAARGVRWPIFSAVREHADVILLDQRGTGLSDPPPACPPSGSSQLPLDMLVTRKMLLASLQAEAVRCAAAWRTLGVDLDAYSTAQSAADIELLRRALGAERVSLWGMS